MPEQQERFKTLLYKLHALDRDFETPFALIIHYLNTGEYGLREAIEEATATRIQLLFLNPEGIFR